MQKVSGRSITLRDFSLMKDGSHIYYAENFGIEDYGYGKVLVPMNIGNKVIDEDTATITKYDGNAIRKILGIDTIDEDTVNFLYVIDDYSNIWCIKKSTVTGQKLGNIGLSCWYADIKATGVDVNSPIIFSVQSGLGIIYRGNATGGSATTLDDTTVDFTTLDISAGDRVYNIKDNKLFTIDAGGIAANQLTITAVDGGDFANLDNYAIINPSWKILSDNDYTYGRQIIEFDEDFYILNGDALAIVTSALAYTAEHKAIESGWIARTGASNGDTIAIGCNKNNLGKIFFWDKHSNGWNKKIILTRKILSITAYGNNYIYVSGNSLWITDGYSKRLLSIFPGTHERDDIDINPNGMTIVENKVIINGGADNYNKAKMGIWIYDILKDEWAYSPYDPAAGTEKSNYGISKGIAFLDNNSNEILYSFKNSGYGWTNEYVLSEFQLASISSRGTVIFNPIPLGKNARIKKIEVNLVQSLKDSNNASSKSKTMTCKLSDCTRPLWRHQQANADSTNKSKIQVDGDVAGNADAQVGDEIFIQDGWNGHLRRRITAIANDGTNTEEWTLDIDLAELTKDNTTIIVMPFQLYGMDEKTITDETKMLEFYPNFYGDNVMIELTITGTSYPMVAIESIKIYYE